MKKSIIIIAVIIVALILGICIYNYFEKEKTEKDYGKAQNITNNELTENELLGDEVKVSRENAKFNPKKMKTMEEGLVYKEYDEDMGKFGLEIEIKDGKPYLSVDEKDEDFILFFPEAGTPVKDKELEGFNSNVVDVYYAFIGNGDMVPLILFLMEDESVEYIPSDKMINNEKYESFGKIESLSNVIKFQNVTVNEIDEDGNGLGGYISAVAIDDEGYAYDLSAITEVRNILGY